MPRRASSVQQPLVFRSHGGKRPGAGRKPNGAKAMVTHLPRPDVAPREPVLVTMKVAPKVWNLRARCVFTRLLTSLTKAKERNGARLVHFSVQHDHVHLIVEVEDKVALSRAMQGLAVRFARAINRAMKRRGRVFADRFHSRVLATPRQVRNALGYVLCNFRKHGVKLPVHHIVDPCSSARLFEGWCDIEVGFFVNDARAGPVVRPRSWLLGVGWKRVGRLSAGHYPGTFAGDDEPGYVVPHRW